MHFRFLIFPWQYSTKGSCPDVFFLRRQRLRSACAFCTRYANTGKERITPRCRFVKHRGAAFKKLQKNKKRKAGNPAFLKNSIDILRKIR
jgi:hypothetical protein